VHVLPRFAMPSLAAPGLAFELAKLADHVSQSTTIDKLHRVVMHAAVGAHGVNRHDVRMVQERRRLGLGLEPRKLARVERGGEGEDLQGHAAAQRDLLGLVDDAHATAADLARDVEITQQPQSWTSDVDCRVTARCGSPCRMRKRGHHLERRQQLAEWLGMLGVRGGEIRRIEHFAGLEPLQELFDQFGQNRIGRASARCRRASGDGHGDSPRMLLKRCKARRWRTLTAPSVSPRIAAISATGSCSRLRMTRTSRSCGAN
jgi:hypothetical protein